MAKGFFITGTDTGVGKTVITAALIKSVQTFGLRVCGMKPIETGCLREDETLIPSDGMFIKKISRMEETENDVSPCRFENPLAPFPAAEIKGRPVSLEKVHKVYHTLSRKYDAVMVEGIGGLLVPVTRDYFVLDLAKDFGLPVIVVGRPGLGTINHTMLTVKYAINEGLVVAGIIINYHHPPDSSLAEATNPEVLTKISPVPLIGVFPHLKDLSAQAIEEAALQNLDLDIIRSYL
ncbi:MAG: dethiobiotin synthase [Nitrospirota bacterium]